eukprot:gene10852-12642_t
MATTTSFKVKISGILVELKNKDTKTLAIQCDLGGLKRFSSSTPVTSTTSTYDFEDEFESTCLVNVDHLAAMKMRFVVSESTALFDNIVGDASTDMLSIATGPIQHTIDLLHNNSIVGNIVFWMILTQVADVRMSLKDVVVEFSKTTVDMAKSHSFFVSFTTGDKTARSKSRAIKNGSIKKWKKLPTIEMPSTTPVALVEMTLFLKVRMDSSNVRESTAMECKIPVVVVLQSSAIKRTAASKATASVSYQLSESLTGISGLSGRLMATLIIEGVPLVVQQINGLNRDKNSPNPYTSAPTLVDKYQHSKGSTPLWIDQTPTIRLERKPSEKSLFEQVKSRRDVATLFTHDRSTLTLDLDLARPAPTRPLVGAHEDKPDDTAHAPRLTSTNIYAILRSILCLYSTNTPRNGLVIDERTVGPLVRDSFSITQPQYEAISSAIIDHSTRNLSKAEIALCYAWKSQHFSPDTAQTTPLKQDQIAKIFSEQQVTTPSSSHPTIQDIFGAQIEPSRSSLKNPRHSVAAAGGVASDIHKGYAEMVSAFVAYTLGESYGNPDTRFLPFRDTRTLFPKAGTSSLALNIRPELAWILREYATVYSIGEFSRHLAVFRLLVRRFDDNLAQVSHIYALFGRLAELRKSGAQMNEEAKFQKTCRSLLEQVRHRLSHYRAAYRLAEGGVRDPQQPKMAMVLRLADKIIRTLEWNDIGGIKSFVASAVVEATERQYKVHKCRYQSMLLCQSQETSECFEIFTLSLGIADICTWLADDYSLFNSVFTSYHQKDHGHIELVAETLTKFIRSDLSIIAQKFMHVDVVKNTRLETPPWLSGILVELLPNLVEFNNQTQKYIKKKLIPLDQNLSFFSGNFVLNSVCMLERYIEAIIPKQEWIANGKNVLHTSAPIDLFTYIWQCYKSIQLVEDKLDIQGGLHILLKSFGSGRTLQIMEMFTFTTEQLKTYYRILIESFKLMDLPPSSCSLIDCAKVMEYFKDTDKSMEQFLKNKKLLKHHTVVIKSSS